MNLQPTSMLVFKPLVGCNIPDTKGYKTEVYRLWVDVETNVQEFRPAGNVFDKASNDE